VTGVAERAKMMSAKVFRWVILLGAIFIITPVALAQSNPRYIRFAGVPNSVKGALYAPDAPQKPAHIGILVMHRASNFMNALAPCVPCETTPGQYSNSVKNFYDYVRQWIDKRF
jgi:hypothetical protein